MVVFACPCNAEIWSQHWRFNVVYVKLLSLNENILTSVSANNIFSNLMSKENHCFLGDHGTMHLVMCYGHRSIEPYGSMAPQGLLSLDLT